MLNSNVTEGGEDAVPGQFDGGGDRGHRHSRPLRVVPQALLHPADHNDLQNPLGGASSSGMFTGLHIVFDFHLFDSQAVLGFRDQQASQY